MPTTGEDGSAAVLPAGSVTARDIVEAAKSGYEYRLDDGGAWSLVKKTTQPVLLVDPQAAESADMRDVARAFRLKSGLTRFPITQETFSPFPATYPKEGVTGWSIGGTDPEGDQSKDAGDIYLKLERVILPLYYGLPYGYAEVMRSAIALNGSFFNTQRMVEQYVRNAYFPTNLSSEAEAVGS